MKTSTHMQAGTLPKIDEVNHPYLCDETPCLYDVYGMACFDWEQSPGVYIKQCIPPDPPQGV